MTCTQTLNSLVIESLWAKQVLSVSQGIAQLEAQLAQLTCLPTQVLLISAGEVKPLLNAEIQQFVQRLKQQGCQLHLVSAACTSFHAAIFDVSQSQNQAVLVIALELDQALQQACLNALGVGDEAAQDGLSVLNCVGMCVLKKKQPSATDMVIMQCDILSQPLGMSGTHKLLLMFERYIQSLPKATKIVSFAINSLWGKKLEIALTHRLQGALAMSNWLASAEQGQQHFLSIKPLFELQAYCQHLSQSPLLLLTLGGGGRLGCLLIGQGELTPCQIKQASSSEFCILQDQDAFLSALHIKGQCQAAYYQQVKQTLKYPKSQYRGINNHYFRWSEAATDTLTL